MESRRESSSPAPQILPPFLERLRRVRWRVLDRLDIQRRAVRSPSVARRFTGVLRYIWLTVVLDVVSFPIYLAWKPQEGFAIFARRSDTMYLDSYVRFLHRAKYSVAIVVTAFILLLANLVVLVFLFGAF